MQILIINNYFCYFEYNEKITLKYTYKLNFYCNINHEDTCSYSSRGLSDLYYKLLRNNLIVLNSSLIEMLYKNTISFIDKSIINRINNENQTFLPHPLYKTYIPYNTWVLLIERYGIKILRFLPNKYKNKHTGQGYELYKLAYLKDNSLINNYISNSKIISNLKRDFKIAI
jgi:hypothetical protein